MKFSYSSLPFLILFNLFSVIGQPSMLHAESLNCIQTHHNLGLRQQKCENFARSPIKSSLAHSLITQSLGSNSIGQQVYAFAVARLGQQVRDGECTSLVFDALYAANAKNYGAINLDQDYVWGTLITTLTPSQRDISRLQVGDIIQFRGVSTYKKITRPDGSWKASRGHYGHHTSIVAGVSGTEILLIHQNAGNNPDIKKTVQRGSIDVNDVQSGIMWVYRPIQ